MLRAYDEAFGDDRTQKGELRIKVSKRNDRFDLFLNVGDKSIRLEKTEIVNFIDPADAPDSEDTVIFENFDERTNYFADDELYHEELPRKED